MSVIATVDPSRTRVVSFISKDLVTSVNTVATGRSKMISFVSKDRLVPISIGQTKVTKLLTIAAKDHVAAVNTAVTGATRVLAIAMRGPIGPKGDSTVALSTVTYGVTFAANQPFRIIGGLAQHVTNLDTETPLVDGVTLDSGHAGDIKTTAMVVGQNYETPLTLPPGTALFLDQIGSLTGVFPDSWGGDVWLVPIARRIDDHHFILAPLIPIHF